MSEILNYLQVDLFRKDDIRTPIYWRIELLLLSFQNWLTKSIGVKKKFIHSKTFQRGERIWNKFVSKFVCLRWEIFHLSLPSSKLLDALRLTFKVRGKPVILVIWASVWFSLLLNAWDLFLRENTETQKV